MRTKLYYLIILMFFAFIGNAQDVTTVEAASDDISANLDLEAVASVFGEAEDLEDFEKRLNDPETQISNLDLNGDGEVDYLRVIEVSEGNTHVVTIQAVIGKDQYQDVATINVVKDDSDNTTVQVVGDVYMYGPDYIIQPVYVHPPVIFVFFWGPLYSPWYSPYYYGYYPPYYRPWRPYPTPHYRTNVHVHVNVNNTYKHTTVRNSRTSVELQNKNRRNDYGKKNPDRSYNARNKDVKNKPEVKTKPNTDKSIKNAPNKSNKTTTGKKVQEDWKPTSATKQKKSNVDKNKAGKSSRENVNKPSQKPSGNKPSVNQGNKTSAKPASKNVNQKSAPKPATRKAPAGKGKANPKRR